MRHLHTVLMTPSPLGQYQAEQTRRAVVGDVVLLEVGAGAHAERRHHAVVLGPVGWDELSERARGFYGVERIDSVELAAEYAPELEQALRDRAWKLAEEEPALVLEPAPDTLPAPPSELEIRRVRDTAGLEDFFSISRTGRRHVPSVEAVRDQNVGVLVGYVDGQAVATARLSGHGEVADIMGIVTRPDYRRKGYGTAMTWAAVGAGREMGCRTFLLTATEMGYPVYVKMGFIPVCTMRTYEPLEARGAG